MGLKGGVDVIISLANNRTSRHWKNINISWEEFLDKVKTTRRTAETIEEYKKLSKPGQDEIKDVGGFVAGKLRDGRRKTGFVEYRSMLTLDMDYASAGIWEQITMFYDFTCCIYSTHRHIPEKPRLRLIIPLSRNVSADEYTAVGRMVASDIGIEQFDDTTYEPTRLMYWPSTSSDGEFIFEKQDGILLDPDKVLSRYKDWHDSSQWPVSSRQTSIVKHSISKQADPLEKGGLIGAFCRTYSITESIDKFISDVYKPSLLKGRYDYIPADSTAGVLIYDDKFAYSHHATDPACSKLCNAFDLVRIHKFGKLDGDERKQLLSYKAMLEFCTQDEEVKRQLAKEREEEVLKEFYSYGDDKDWQLSLELNKNGSVKDTPTNILTIMRRDPRLKGIAYNQMTYLIDVNGKLPWGQVKPGWNDTDFAHLKMYLDRYYGIWSPTKVKDALLTAASERVFHPIRDYLDGLPVWDGAERVDRLLIDYLGAEDNSYIRAVMRKTLVAAVARIYEPGTKFDYILVLSGPQGIGKSTFFAKLGGKWFSDSLTISDMRDKSGAEKLQGYWILELGELAGLRKIDVETVKSFITRTDDKFRQSYGVNVENHPRQCVIVGSTNSTGGFLRDVTGNRRFWPVRVSSGTKKVWEMTEIDQIWAEALVKYRKGEELILTVEVEQMACEEQRDAMESDDREGLVENYLETLLPEDWNKIGIYERRNFIAGESEFGGEVRVGTVKRKRVCPIEIWCECFGKERNNIRRTDSYEIEAILMRIGGWKRYDGNKKGNMKFAIYDSQRAFVRIEKNAR